MNPIVATLFTATVLSVLGGCALRSEHVLPSPTDAQAFEAWDCDRLQRERDRVQRIATRLAYAFDERAGNNIIAMGLGLSVFWPALLTMRPTQPEAQELAALKGRFEALAAVASQKACSDTLTVAEQRQLAVRTGDVLTYEQRNGSRTPPRSWSVRVESMTRQGGELASAPVAGAAAVAWRFDRLGNLLSAPVAPVWPQLLRSDLELGTVISGELLDPSDSVVRARVRGQVVAVGPQRIGGRTLDAAVLDLFGDAQGEVGSARLDGVLVVDRSTGLLLRLDLFSPHPAFELQRRLVRIQRVP